MNAIFWIVLVSCFVVWFVLTQLRRRWTNFFWFLRVKLFFYVFFVIFLVLLCFYVKLKFF